MNTGKTNQPGEDANEQQGQKQGQQGQQGAAFVNHEGQQIDLGTLRSRMDQEIVRRVEAEGKGARSNQAFFDAYKEAHQQKHGTPFSIER